MSNVYWAFKNAFKEFNTITFEGPVIQCLDLKRAILQKTRTQGKEVGELNYGLVLCNAQTGEEYRSDVQHIQRNTSVLVKRVPARASEVKKLTVAPATKILPTIDAASGDTNDPFGPSVYGKEDAPSKQDLEKSKIFALMKGEEPEKFGGKDGKKWKSNWKKAGSKPPANYTCFSCQIPGHWIWDCPNKGKKTTVQVEAPVVVENPATTLLVKTLMRKNGLLQDDKKNAKEHTLLAPYCCNLCKNMFRKPTLTPCCKQSFCDECIRQYLVCDDRYTCPFCDERISPDDLEPNEKLNKKLNEIKEKLGDPGAEPTQEDLEQMFPAEDFRKNRHKELPTVNSTQIVCLHCHQKGHMFKDCPNIDKEIIESGSDENKAISKENNMMIMENPPNLLTNPAPLAPNPLGSALLSNLNGGVFSGGLLGESHIPSFPQFAMELQKMSNRKRRDRSRSRDRRRRRGRRRRRDVNNSFHSCFSLTLGRGGKNVFKEISQRRLFERPTRKKKDAMQEFCYLHSRDGRTSWKYLSNLFILLFLLLRTPHQIFWNQF